MKCQFMTWVSFSRLFFTKYQTISKIKQTKNLPSFPICWVQTTKAWTLSPLVATCRLLITFANSLDPDQAQQNVGPDLDPNCLTLWWYSWKIFLKKLIFKKNLQMTKKHAKLSSIQRVKCESNGIAQSVEYPGKQFFLFLQKTYIAGNHWNTHNICFLGETRKVSIPLGWNRVFPRAM